MGKRTVPGKKKKKSSTSEEWTKFHTVPVAPEITEKQGIVSLEVNNKYTVVVRGTTSVAFKDQKGDPFPMIHLAIKRNVVDGQRDDDIRNWEEIQRVKTEVMGDNVEAFELYPAEARRIDTPHEYHLWCLPQGIKIPVGFVPQELRVRPDELDENGEPVVRRLTPEEIVEDDKRIAKEAEVAAKITEEKATVELEAIRKKHRAERDEKK